MAPAIRVAQVGELCPHSIFAARLPAILKQLRDPLEQIHSATALEALSRSTLVALLMQRDTVLERRDPTGEDRALEIACRAPISLKRLFEADGYIRPVLVSRYSRPLSAQS